MRRRPARFRSAGENHFAHRLYARLDLARRAGHPMGYSELRFGYWSNDPLSLDDYIKI